MIFKLSELNLIHELMAECESEIRKRTGLSVRLNMTVRESKDIEPCVLLEVVADSLGMSMGDYQLRTRKTKYVVLRQLATVFMKRFYPHMSLSRIADYFGGRHHTTMIYALRQTEQFLENGDELFVASYNMIEARLLKLFGDEEVDDKT